MDVSLISGAVASINAAKELGAAALGVRDFNKAAPMISSLNAELLKAQETLFTLSGQLLALQQQHFDTVKELAELRNTLIEKDRYLLFALAPGNFVYRANPRRVNASGSDAASTEPEHYVCQQCFDGPEKRKVLLRKTTRTVMHAGARRSVHDWFCPGCNTSIRVA